MGKEGRRVGLWTSAFGFSKDLYDHHRHDHEFNKSSSSTLDNIIWPGLNAPTSRLVQMSGRKYRVLVPGKGFPEFVSVHYDQERNVTTFDGFSIDVFHAAIARLPYDVSVEFITFVNGSYNDMVMQVYLQGYDGAVGDITITPNRSQYVDFSMPYTDLGVAVVAKLDVQDPWFFLRPLRPELWIISGCFFVLMGFIVWLIEHRTNSQFQGSPAQQMGTILWFAASTLVYAHRNTHVQGVTKSNLNFADNRLKPYQSPVNYYDALSQGSKNGGVSAIIGEIPYIKLFLAKYAHIKYSIIESLLITYGFGFAFPKGSPLVHEISAAVLQLREEGKLSELEKKWFTSGSSEPMLSPDSAAGTAHATNTLSIDSFYGLFLVAGTQSQLPPNSNHRNPKTQYRKQTIQVLQKCRNTNQIASVHGNIVKNSQEQDHFIVFELLRVCSKCDAIEYALKIFEQIQEPNIYLYTALIDGLVLSGSYDHGISMYLQMIESFVMLKLIELYGKCGEFDAMKRVFDEMPERDVVAMTVMMFSYLEHELVERACGIFDLVKVKDTVCWTAMIDGLVRNGEMSKALEYFRQMQREGVRANELTVVCVLSGCAQLGALELGKWVHSYMEKYDIEVNHFVGSALINMYSRCGSIEEAGEVFERMEEREVSTYNSMIVGFALNGKSTQALEMFQRMINDGKRPTNITFVGVLNACSHGGLVDFGFEIFERMQIDYHVEPQIEHYGCVVDLLGRAGQVEEAYKFIQNMKLTPDHIIWGSLLSACIVHEKYVLGEQVAKILLNHDCSDTGSYVLVSNFYSSCGRWKEALLVRAKLKESGIQKKPGCSSIEVGNEIHEFLLGDIRHPQKKAIYRKLEEMDQKLRLEGYYPQVDVVSQDLKDQEKEKALAIHSERLAICYGLISTEPRSTLRIVKNLRVLSVASYETMRYKAKETGYIEPYTEVDDSDVDNKLMEVGSHIRVIAIAQAMMARLLAVGSSANKEGFRVNKKVKRLEVRRPRAVTREGCKAMIMVRKEKSGTWIVAKVENQHSHPLGMPPGKVRRRSVQAWSQDEKDKRIHELSAELHCTKQQLAKCQKQLDAALNDVELHVNHLTRSIQHIVQNVKEVGDQTENHQESWEAPSAS
ncbi:UNVERIFIED_CONTAM: putative pentatricopeptide repeat-containing protein, chloroplastic [Sesamum angustifolium]|uniref:Pentatricopeptide repeat-containing protein, chloroplastic n=1 Tax=Sesamum angustifolium TaxID=2727405 RepID=A0AAW2QQF6_9LAMI